MLHGSRSLADPGKSMARKRPRPLGRGLTVLLLLCLFQGQPVLAADDAAGLRDEYQNLTQQLSHNPFRRQLHLDSAESPNTLKGDIYAVMDYPFATVESALNDPARGPANWCEVLMLHLNTKLCQASAGSKGSQLSMSIGKKVEQDMDDAYRMDFSYRAAASGNDYFRVELDAGSGPLGTRDYRIALEAVAIKGNRTFLHLTYSYSYGMAGRMAMKTYLSTLGSDKVGFTPVGNPSSSQTEYIGGVRGVVERNAMRYYLAIDAFLGTLSSPPDKRQELRLTRWFNATEQYARQLHEVERQDYMQMKLKQYHAGRGQPGGQTRPTRL